MHPLSSMNNSDLDSFLMEIGGNLTLDLYGFKIDKLQLLKICFPDVYLELKKMHETPPVLRLVSPLQ